MSKYEFKILNYVIEGDMIRVTTDNKDRPEFVYKKDKFGTKEGLLCEIDKSIKSEKKRIDKKVLKINNLEAELNG